MSTELPTSNVTPPPFRSPYRTGIPRPDSLASGIAQATGLATYARNLPAPPSVHSLPTTDKPPRPQSFREQSVARCKPDIQRLEAIYSYGSVDPAGNKRKRLEGCRTNATIMQHAETHELRVAARHCNQRWCPMCQASRRWIITNSVRGWLAKTKHPKFITLTLKSSTRPLEDQVENLYTSFRRLRRKSWLARGLVGGVWFFQFTYNHKTDQYHPHVHCLVDGDYIPHSKLKRAWLDITTDSYIVDIRKVDDNDKAAAYVARYATAPAQLRKVTIARGAQAIIALHGRRIVGSFGSAKGIPLAPRKPDEPSKWHRVAHYWFAKIRAQIDPMFELLFVYLENPNDYTPPLFDLMPAKAPPPVVMDDEPMTWKQATFGFDDYYDCQSPMGLLNQHRPEVC